MSTAARPRLVVQGTVLQTPSVDRFESLVDVAVVVGDDGRITAVLDARSEQADTATADAVDVVRLSPDERLLPGLIDCHNHAPQWPQLGTGLDLPLERWLFEYTFPLESRYRDAAFAASVWDHMVPSLLAHGTTTAVYYATTDERATTMLAESCLRHGQRAFVGRVAMDHPEGTPEWYRDIDASAGIDASARSIDEIRALAGPVGLVQPIITPRFIPACTDDLLSGLGALAASTGVLVQTHCSESDWEHHHVLERCGRRDSEALHAAGLLRRGAVLAHGNHLDDQDFDLLRVTGSGVAHCPMSNAYFAGAIFPAARAMARGVAVGLGSDVSGGYHPGLLPQCAMAVTASRLLDDGVDGRRPATDRGVPGSRIDTIAAFHMATLGGADLLGIDAGVLSPGRWFDAFVVRLDRPGSALRMWDGLDDEARVFDKIVHLAARTDICAVWVAGRAIDVQAS